MTPLWFGPSERPLAGWLHLPADGRARGGVVLCPPAGYEAVCAHRTFLVIADRLAAAGFAALRFDYDGTGDSAGAQTEPDRLAAWVASVGQAVTVLRAAGAPAVAAVGMRLGATLAATMAAADDTPLDALVLWDPVWSGRAYVRQLRALHLLGIGAVTTPGPDDGALAVAGAVYPAGTVDELRRLTMPDLATVKGRVLVVSRPEQPPPVDLPASVETAEAVDQAALLDVASLRAVVPDTTIDAIVAWLRAALPATPVTLTPPRPRLTARPADAVVETFLSVGDTAMFAVRSEAVGGADPAAPVLLLLNNSIDHHIGPNRMWVEWGRAMAAHGFVTVRLDLTGIGDSAARAGEAVDHPYGPSSVADIAAAVLALDVGAGVVPVGLCSGARNALDAAALVPVRGVCAVNPPLHLSRAVMLPTSPGDPAPVAIERINAYHRVRHHLRRAVPTVAWRLVDRLGLVPSRARALQATVDSGADTLVVSGADDFFLMRVRRDSAWHLRRLATHPSFRLVIVDDVDHALFAPAGRTEVFQIIGSHLLDRYRPSGTPQPTGLRAST